jgi:hypothetical protein
MTQHHAITGHSRQTQRVRIWLARILMLAGAFLMVATFAIFLPVHTMARFHEFLGLGDFPDRPITAYLARSTSLLYAVHGLLMFYTGLTIEMHWRYVPLFGWLHIAIGSCTLMTDLLAPMPTYWTVIEGGPVAALGILILIMYQIGFAGTQ